MGDTSTENNMAKLAMLNDESRRRTHWSRLAGRGSGATDQWDFTVKRDSLNIRPSDTTEREKLHSILREKLDDEI